MIIDDLSEVKSIVNSKQVRLYQELIRGALQEVRDDLAQQKDLHLRNELLARIDVLTIVLDLPNQYLTEARENTSETQTMEII